ncbi:hypothetical protein WME90_20930 [Sorangium sp. So ce375]|uniref:hypothetical protein n=1 Tax=Sorangium sp. So ce375 TaxID=3133306 RepID=UPI003F5C3F39
MRSGVVSAALMYFRLDQLGKNILRDFFVLVGAAETEVEVPAGDAQRIDVWHVPNPDLLGAHPEIEPGLLRSMAAEAGMVEVFSGAPGVAELHGCMRKRHQWHHTLELRAERELELPWAWLVSAGRPDGVLRDFGFVRDAAGPEGHYVGPAPGWRIHAVVIAELPRVRSTVLLRLLGSPRVRRAALRDLAALPEDAWERRVALPWLVRLSFEVPEQLLLGLPSEERDLIMETREWYEQFTARREAALKEAAFKESEAALKESEAALKEARRQAEEAKEAERRARLQGEQLGQLQMTARLCALRLGRPLTEAETAALAERLDRLREDRVGEVVLSFSADALAAWLSEPNAT